VFISQGREGDAVSGEFAAIDGRRFSATVTEVGVERSSASSTFEVRARLESADLTIRSGMACEVTFEFEAVSGSEHFVVPAIAVREDQDGRFVFVVELTEDELGLTRRRNVEVGALRSDGIEIISGLQEGELVVIAGVSKIKDGQTVRMQAP
jgi:RND family efflux transporter MFP subunit